MLCLDVHLFFSKPMSQYIADSDCGGPMFTRRQFNAKHQHIVRARSSPAVLHAKRNAFPHFSTSRPRISIPTRFRDVT